MPRSSEHLRIDVPRGMFVHRSESRYFRRVGGSRRELSPEQLAGLFEERSWSRAVRFDELVVPGTSLDNLDKGLVRRLFRQGVSQSGGDLPRMGVVAVDEDEVLRLTVAGVLMCTREPGNRMPHAQIQAASYAGGRRDINYRIDARDLAGPLDSQVTGALDFVVRNMSANTRRAGGRGGRSQFSEQAVFEALVNAVAHRDYSIAGARVRLHMFADRIELYVPGALAGTLTPESMHLRQCNRNELIVSLLARCGVSPDAAAGRTRMMERRGNGVPIILGESYDLSGIRPRYGLTDDGELRLVIWAGSAGSDCPE